MLVFFSHEKICAVEKRENHFQLVFSLFVDGCCTSCCFGEIKKIQWNEQRNTAKEKSGGDWRETLTYSYE